MFYIRITGLQKQDALDMATKMGFDDDAAQQAAETFMKLYNLFITKDATLIEINPLSEDREGNGKYLNNVLYFFVQNC